MKSLAKACYVSQYWDYFCGTFMDILDDLGSFLYIWPMNVISDCNKTACIQSISRHTIL